MRMRRKVAQSLSLEPRSLPEARDEPNVSPRTSPSTTSIISVSEGIDSHIHSYQLLDTCKILESKKSTNSERPLGVVESRNINCTKNDDNNRKLRQKMCLGIALAAMTTLLVCIAFKALNPSIVIIISLSCYMSYNELLRVPSIENRFLLTDGKLRRLMERRRAAGLRRLESETASRRDLWSAPPASIAAAFLKRSHTSMSVPAAVDYRLLAIEAFHYLAALRDRRIKDGHFSESRELEGWIVRQLLQSGVRPSIDMELFKLLHNTLDMIEKGFERKDKHGDFHCRLCLSQLYNGNFGVKLKCDHEVCKSCCKSLVDNALEGKVDI